jgi:hypothetical protein
MTDAAPVEQTKPSNRAALRVALWVVYWLMLTCVVGITGLSLWLPGGLLGPETGEGIAMTRGLLAALWSVVAMETLGLVLARRWLRG